MDIFAKIIDLFIYADLKMLVLNIVILSVVRAMFAAAVYMLAKDKGLYCFKKYAKYTFSFGIIGLIVFVLVSRDTKAVKIKLPIALIVISSLVLTGNCIFFCNTYSVAEYNATAEYYGFNYSEGVFEKENGEKIRYNNLGQAFTIDNMDGFFYEARNGDRIPYSLAKEGMPDDNYVRYFIDEDGYIVDITESACYYVQLKNDLYVKYDKNGNIYYYVKNCYFDKDGKLFFSDSALEKVTYENLMNFIEQSK